MNGSGISEICIAMKFRPGRSRVQMPAKERNILFSKTHRPALEPTHPLVNGYQGYFPGVKAVRAWS